MILNIDAPQALASKTRHLFFGLMKVYRREYTILALMILIQVISSFASPVGLNRLLKSVLVKLW